MSFPSLFDGLARSISMRKGKSHPTEDGREAAKELARDARKKEMMLSSVGTIRSSMSSTFASVCSKTGNKGINQDSFIVWEEFGCQEDMTFCGIFDGHGPWGHLVSRRVCKSVPASLLCHWQENVALIPHDMGSEIELNDFQRFEIWKQAYLKTYAAVDKELKHNPNINCYGSGTTAVTIVKQGEHLLIAHVGDSRAVLATTSDDGIIVPLQLTVDFKPDLPQEAARIIQSKGKVTCMDDEPGVYRIWAPNDGAPGLAVSRAFGDYCAKEFGLISVPDVAHRKLTSKDRFIILATDGVWDVLSNEEAVQIVCSAPQREKSAKTLVQCAARAWKRKKCGIAVDDISAICLFFKEAQPADFSLKVAREINMIATAG